jgi:hypothetical protein
LPESSGFVCLPSIGTYPWMPTELCTSPYAYGTFSFVALSINSPDTTGSVTPQTFTITAPASRLPHFDIYAYSVQIRYQTPFNPQKTRSSTTRATTNSPTPSSSTTRSPASLSTGARAGIGVPVAIIGIGIICGVLFYLCRRRRQPRPTDLSGAVERQPYNLHTKPELDATPAFNVHQGPNKIGTDAFIPELDTTSVPSTNAYRNQQHLITPMAAPTPSSALHSGSPHTSCMSENKSVPATPFTPTQGIQAEPPPHTHSFSSNLPSPSPITSLSEHPSSSTPNQDEIISLVSGAETSSAVQQELARIHEDRERLKKLIELDRREEQLRKRAKELAEDQSGSKSAEV